MKSFVICIATIILTLAGPVVAQRFEGPFCGPLIEQQDFSQTLAEVSPPEVAGCARAERNGASKKAVNLIISGDLRDPDAITAFDTNSGNSVSVHRSEAGWTARIVIGGETEIGEITVLRGVMFTYSSGDTALTLEREASRYIFSGRTNGGPAGVASTELSPLSRQGGGEAFTLEFSGGRLNFSRRSVSGVSADPELSGIMTALYMALLRDAGSGLLRTVHFGGRPGMDGPNYGWTSCSATDEPYISSDVEYRETGHLNNKVRVCEVEVTYTCHWKKCEELYPNLEPGRCYCKATCSKSSHNTGRCEWVDAE